MKKSVLAFCSLALVLLLGLASCNPEPTGPLNLNTNYIEVDDGSSVTLDVFNVPSTASVEWCAFYPLYDEGAPIKLYPNRTTCVIEGLHPGFASVYVKYMEYFSDTCRVVVNPAY